MRMYGNLMNRISEHTLSPVPEVGMGATIYLHSDRLPCTVERVSPSGKTARLREDTAIRIDQNGMSELQKYRFEPNPNGRAFTARRRENGTWRAGSNGVSFGARSKYYDFSF